MKNAQQTIHTLGELKKSGWQTKTVKAELRNNLIDKMRNKETLFPGIIGYDKTVLPQIQHAILSHHDIILLGLRGQAKTRMLRSLALLLDEYIPIVKGSEINDDPFNPISKYARELIEQKGDSTPIEWLHRSQRYGEKLATPDTTVADLIGDIDPIKAAANKLNLADENVINFGLIPRTNRGLFVINELPDLQPRIQVALLNIMQERDIQIRGFNIRMPLDIFMAFSANPEDYTNRGNIITPLKDRIDAQIITHYPKTIDNALEITKQEAWHNREQSINITFPDVFREIVERTVFVARESEFVDQQSGVSTRMSITALEQVVSAAERRAILNNQDVTTIRIADLYHMIPALTGKMELVYEGEQEGTIKVAKHIIGKAINITFKNYFPNPQSKSEQKNRSYQKAIDWFSKGNEINLPDILDDAEYRKRLDSIPLLDELIKKYADAVNDDEKYAWKDFILESLHQNSMLSKQDLDSDNVYSDLLGAMFSQLNNPEEDDDNFEF